MRFWPFVVMFILSISGCSDSSVDLVEQPTTKVVYHEVSGDQLLPADGADESALPPSVDPDDASDDAAASKPEVNSATLAATYQGLKVRKIVQNYPDKSPHRVFAAKLLPGNTLLYHGPYAEYYSNGQQQKSAQYEHGMKTGEWTFWSKDGGVRKQGRYVNDKQTGTWKKFRADGTLEWIEQYLDGVPSGTWEGFQEDGKTPLWQRNYLDGERHGEWRDFFADGSIRALETYEHGKRNGATRSWFENGRIAAEGNYENGKPHGEAKVYGPSGNVRSRVVWEHGVRVSGK